MSETEEVEEIERPNLSPSKRLKCGKCVYFKHFNEDFKGACRDVFDITPKSRACVDFELHIDPRRYRKNKQIRRYNEIMDKYEEVHMFLDEIEESTGNVFRRAEVRAGKRKVLRPVAAVLRGKAQTTDLIPFFSDIQEIRDRIAEIQSIAIRWSGEIEIILQSAKAYVHRRYPEIRNLRPEAVRIATLRSILAEVWAMQVRVATVQSQCESALRNLSSEHNALLEIQAAARSPATVRTKPVSSRKEAGDFIPRKGKKRRRKKRR